MKVPVSTIGVKDRLVWNITTNGQFLVKSEYKIAKNIKQKASGDEGSSTRREDDKEKLWKKYERWTSKRKSSISFGKLAMTRF